MKKNGFTIIELIIVMAIFLFVLGAALVVFISVIWQQKGVLSEQQFLNQASYAEEYMSKEIRMAIPSTPLIDTTGCLQTGDIYELTRPVGGLYTGIKFLYQVNETSYTCQEFFLGLDENNNPVLEDLKNNQGDSFAVPFTSSNLQIKSLKFAINGEIGADGGTLAASIPSAANTSSPVQPRLTITLNIAVPGDPNAPTRTIQTTVSQRKLNVAP